MYIQNLEPVWIEKSKLIFWHKWCEKLENVPVLLSKCSTSRRTWFFVNHHKKDFVWSGKTKKKTRHNYRPFRQNSVTYELENKLNA